MSTSKPKQPMKPLVFDFAKALAKLKQQASEAQQTATTTTATASASSATTTAIDSIISVANAEPRAAESVASLTFNPNQSAKQMLIHAARIEAARLPATAEQGGTSSLTTTSNQTNVAANVTDPTSRATEQGTAEPANDASSTPSPAIQWDESQLAAIDKILSNQFCCLIGAAGSGKTTVVKEIVRRLREQGVIQPLDYQRCNGQTVSRFNISFCSFTGKAVEQLRKSIPPELQCCCETIHSLLEYAPVIVEKVVTDSDGKTAIKNSKIFEPRRDEFTKLNQNIIVIDESGMVGIDLWNNLYKALDLSNPNLKIILIGDINQLPAVIGKSILGYALNSSRWATACLTHIHRQAMDNPIIANAHAVKDGKMPVASEPLFDAEGNPALRKFQLVDIGSLTTTERQKVKDKALPLSYYDNKNKPQSLLRNVVKVIAKLYQNGAYNPEVDQIIVPQNVGMLGQEILNQRLAPLFNSANERRAVRASYETKFLAVGDKVMFTKNDYDLGILNGMTGYIKNISLNTNYPDYAIIKAYEERDFNDKSNNFIIDTESQELAEKVLDDLAKMEEKATDDPTKTAEQEASHIVVVEYTPLGSTEPAEIALHQVGAIRGLLLAYAITCHKAQGSEYRRVIVVTCSANSQMLSREWLYTAVTRARENCVLVYNDYSAKGISSALRRQIVKGETIEEKAANFSLAESAKESTNLQRGLIPLGIFTNQELESIGEVAE